MLQCTDIKKQPTANIIDGNVQLHILSLIPDNFQGVTEIVSDVVCFVALRPKSTAMVIAGQSVHLTTLFPGQA